ncbi:MAG: hypothetical protein AB8B53_11220 [Flavobacteriales bacterium]
MAVALTCFFSACDGIHNSDVLGKWNVKAVNLSNVSLDPTQENNLTEELESMVFYFKDDGLLLYSNFYRSGAHGQWKLNPEQMELTCTYQFERASYSDEYTILVKERQLVLTSTDFEGVTSAELVLVRSAQ